MQTRLKEKGQKSPPDLRVATAVRERTRFDVYRNTDLSTVHIRIYPDVASPSILCGFADVESGLLTASFEDVRSRIEDDLIKRNGLSLRTRGGGEDVLVYTAEDLSRSRALLYQEAANLRFAFRTGM